MTWDTKDIYARRQEFISLAKAKNLHFRTLCRRFGISTKTGYKWLRRHQQLGEAGLKDQTPKPSRKSNQTPKTTEDSIIALRKEHPTWGPRKLQRRLQDLGHDTLPAISSIARLLKRQHLIHPKDSQQHKPHTRFQRPHPNDLWQIDFKGHFPLSDQTPCHPLTIIDDHSRYLIGLYACINQQTLTVQKALTHAFKIHGLPRQILCDNGSPWGAYPHEHTQLTVWLMRIGIHTIHGRPYHPQTQGKNERFNKTLKHDLLNRHDWHNLTQTQQRFNQYRHLYNHIRPHQALNQDTPAKHYSLSQTPMPKQLTQPTYSENTLTRTVKSKGEITFLNQSYYIGRAFIGMPIAIQPTQSQNIHRISFASFPLGFIDSSPNQKPSKHHYISILHHL